MTLFTRISRRGALQTAAAMLAAFAGQPKARAAAQKGGTSARNAGAQDAAVCINDGKSPSVDVPRLVDVRADTVLVARGPRAALWFDLVEGVYVGRYGTRCSLTRDERAGTFALALPDGRVVRLS